MLEEDLEVAVKVVVVGNGGVGKSSMIQRFCKGIFTKDYKKTIGVDFLEKHMKINEQETRLMLWDTAGQEEFDSITKAYYRGANVCVVAFSTVDRDSFLAVESWKKKVEAEVGDVIMCVVQNKIDLIDKACMTPEEVDTLAKTLRLKLFRTSVKENFNVDEVFKYLCTKFLNKRAKKLKEMMNKQTALGFSNGHEIAQEAKESITIGVSNGTKDDTRTNDEQSFQIKPNKQRAKKTKTPGCALL